MAGNVVYLPTDPRWDVINQGIARLGQNIGEAYTNKQLADILQKGQATGNFDTAALLRVGGDKGLALAQLIAEIGKTKAQTTEAQANTGLIQQEASVVGPKAKADIAKNQSEVSLNEAKSKEADAKAKEAMANVELNPYKRAQLLAAAAKDYSEANLAAQKATLVPTEKTELEARTKKEQAQADQAANAASLTQQFLGGGTTGQGGSGTPSMPTVSDLTNSLTPEQQAAIKLAAASGKPEAVATELNRAATANKPTPLPGDAAKIAGNASATANNLTQILTAVQSGDISGGPIDQLTAYAQDRGWIQPGQDRATALEAVHQLTYNRATAGGGFGGQWKINISKDTLPNFRKGPAQNIISAAVIAQDQLAELQAQKNRFKGTTVQTQALDDAIKATQDVIKQANSLRVDKKTGIVSLGDKVIQGKNGFVPSDMLPSGQQIAVGNTQYSSDDLNATAIKHGIKVTDVIATLRQYQLDKAKP